MSPPVRAQLSDLRVLLTSDGVGGVFSYSATLARALCLAGARVTFVVQGPRASQTKLAALRGICGLDVVETDLAVEWLDPDGADMARTAREFARIAAAVRPNVVHLCGFREATFDWPAPVVITAHSCVGTWWRACRGDAPDATWNAYTRAVENGLNAADGWIAPSQAFCREVEALYGPRTRGHVVHNGIPVRKPNLSGRNVLAAGRMWDEAKDVSTIVAAAAHARWPVEIAGPLRSEGASRAIDAQAATLLGELAHADLARVMREAGIFVSAAVYEPFGLSVLEAAASGCALVLSDIPSMREIWGEAALFFAARDPHDLARQVNALADDDALRARMTERAVARAARYGITRFRDETVAVYRSVMRARATSRFATLTQTVPAQKSPA